MRISLYALMLLLPGCSFEPVKKTVQLRMTLPPPPYASMGARLVRPLDQMGYSVTVRGNGLQPSYQASALGGRLPECLALGGRVSSFHTYEALTARGMELTLDSGNWTISINAYYPKPTAPLGETIASGTEIFLIGSVVVNTANSDHAGLSAAGYLGQSSPEELFAKCRDNVYTVQALSAPNTGRCKNTGPTTVSMWSYVIGTAGRCPLAAEYWPSLPAPVASNSHVDLQCPGNGNYKVCCVAGNNSANGSIPANFPPNSNVESTICGQ